MKENNNIIFPTKGLYFFICYSLKLPDMNSNIVLWFFFMVAESHKIHLYDIKPFFLSTGWRSVNRDLESQIVLITANEDLQKSLHQEQERLYNLSDQVTDKTFGQPDRWVPFWVRCVMPIIKVFF